MAQVGPLERLSLSSSVSPRPRSSSCVSGCGDPFAPVFSVTILEGLDRAHMFNLARYFVPGCDDSLAEEVAAHF